MFIVETIPIIMEISGSLGEGEMTPIVTVPFGNCAMGAEKCKPFDYASRYVLCIDIYMYIATNSFSYV